MLAAPEWTKVDPEGELTPPYHIFTKPLEKPQVDDRDYSVIKLENGLTALLIHDAHTKHAAASLDVAVGHLADPEDMPGLAHFCEHLLFMGTKQFPKENEYSEYLSKHNGSSNAFTSSSNTNYHFRVSPGSFHGALERFSAFFHSPLFTQSCTLREINAVDSEHKKNHQSDAWRIFQLNKSLSTPGHPWRKFGSGNRDTLLAAAKQFKKLGNLATDNPVNGNGAVISADTSTDPSPIPSQISSPVPSSSSTDSELDAAGGLVGRETRRRLMEWWSKEYCASRMRLCVIGKETPKQLADMVSSLFSPVLNRGQDPLPLYREHPFGPEQKGTLVSVQTIISLYAVEISFPIDWQPPLWKSKPGQVLTHFLGHEAPGSLFAYLKAKGWISSLSAGTQDLAHGFAMIKATMELTKDGFDNYRSVVLTTFKYLALLRSSQFYPWHLNEIATIMKTEFHFVEKRASEAYVVALAGKMHWPVPFEKLLSAPVLVHGWEDAKTQQQVWNDVLAALENMQAETGRVVLMAKKEEHERIAQIPSEWVKEAWYGTEYKIERWDDEFLAKASRTEDIPDLYLPGPNPFMPINFDVERRDVPEPQRRPHLIAQSEVFKLWYKKDDQFWLPKAKIIIDIRSPTMRSSPRATVLGKLFVRLVNDSLEESTYDAKLAGLEYEIADTPLGLIVVVQGYNDKLARFAERIVAAMKDLLVKEDRLKKMKEELERKWSNFFLQQSYLLSDHYTLYMLSHQAWTPEELLKELPDISSGELTTYCQQLFKRISMHILVLGNIYEHEAITLSKDIERLLEASPLSQMPYDLALVLPDGCNYVWTTSVRNREERNSALTYYVHLGQCDDARRRVLGYLLAQILREPAFDVLRTKEQLGYIVACSSYVLPGESQFGLRLLVQSERSTGYLEERVEAFLGAMDGKLQEMEMEDFNNFKLGLQQMWREPDKNLGEESMRFWKQISNGFLDFFRRWEDADLLQNIGKDEVLALFRERVHPRASNRSKLSIHVQSQVPRARRVSMEAMDSFEVLVRKAGRVDDLSQIKAELRGRNPVIEDFANLTGDAQGLVGKLQALVEQYPHPDEHHMADVTPVQDIKTFKAGLQVSLPPQPIVQWNDRPGMKG